MSNYPDNMDWAAHDAAYGYQNAAEERAEAARPAGWYKAQLAAMNTPLAIAESNLRHAERMVCNNKPGDWLREHYVAKLPELRANVEALQVMA